MSAEATAESISVRPTRSVARWRWWVRQRTLAVVLPERFRVLSWAPLNGGFRTASVIVNHQIAMNDRGATEAPARYLGGVLRRLGFEPDAAVAMMTGASVAAAACARARADGIAISAWCTAGCSNALRIGDPATAGDNHAGTVNLIVVVNQALSSAAMAEAVQLATEARVLAMQAAAIRSVRSGRRATGTGTDCIAIAAPARGRAIRYCGKHTRLGELLGKAVLQSCAEALANRAR